jgi:hypothetical protein
MTLKEFFSNLQLKIEDIMNQEELEKDNSGMIAMLPMAPAGETC